MGAWLEQYADNQDLVVWLRSTLEPKPTYDAKTRKWNVVVNRDGELVHLQPSHIVIATSIHGAPIVPEMDGKEEFLGEISHSATFDTAEKYKGKKVIVVGAGNSGESNHISLSFLSLMNFNKL